ncbi:putative membrane protein [Bradyrhizobium sp. USDA 4516]
MVEFALIAGLLGVTGGALVTGFFGSRYIDQKLRYQQTIVRTDQPVILPPDHPAITWESVRNS